MNELTLIQKIAVWALPVIFAITVHEVAHGWAASKFGDQSARMLGRLTLNPIKHIDPIGTIVVPLALLMLGGFIFGWAKPVPVNARNFKRPRHDMAWVAMAGPFSNLIMAILWAIVIKIGVTIQSSVPEVGLFLTYSGLAGVSINLILLVLNLLPIPPLDGSHVVSALLSPRLAWQYNRIAPFGFIILIVLMVMGLLTPILIGPYTFIQQLIYSLVGLH
ncbi:site-2 protease family protein [Thiomicrorhabdus sp.]|uniref:site-2 protease family protein n=1 Tax=Thiomicrorhabdus sp. TaxID=2039724 RepID=UPI003563C454